MLAFQADVTRIATFMFAREGSEQKYRMIGITEGHHELTHHFNNQEKIAKVRKINTFHVQQFAYLVSKLKAIPEGSGTLLDNCMVAYGSGNSDGNRHSHDNVPLLLAGKGGGTIKTGRHARYPRETPLNNCGWRCSNGGAHGEDGRQHGRLQGGVTGEVEEINKTHRVLSPPFGKGRMVTEPFSPLPLEASCV